MMRLIWLFTNSDIMYSIYYSSLDSTTKLKHLPCTKAAAHMLLRDLLQLALHHLEGWVGREAEAVEACMRRREVVGGLHLLVYVQFWAQPTEAIRGQIFHWSPKEEKLPLLLNWHALDSLPEPVNMAIFFFVAIILSMWSPIFQIYTVVASP